MKQNKAWFEDWFDSPYYHILYDNRNIKEASGFISKLLDYLQPKASAHFLDLACGKGRHSVFLNSLGYKVDGIDLSKESIASARKYENESLRFAVADMRDVYKTDTFDYVLNLFTSFGYFDNRADNHRTLKAIHQQLKEGGVLLIDFLNIHKITPYLPFEGEVEKSGIRFHIKKYLAEGRIIKEINFKDQGNEYQFTEKVQAIDQEELCQMLVDTGYSIKTIWGNYGLSPYAQKESDRLIILAEKL